MFDGDPYVIVIAVVVFLMFGACVAWVLRPSRQPPRARSDGGGYCARCGYDVRATPNRCPECGTASPWSDRR